MSVEIIGALAMMAGGALVVVATLLAVGRQRRHIVVPPVLSAADQRLLPYLKLTSAQWLALTDFQRSNLRERAHRSMN
ncbi:hypothetical protein GCM10027404_23360 [Arthrobacter tumbae]|uniref:hypothetical protein n=1 Tax=Arthrobacter tumbae TaxID=163874 RepID=UPI00195C1747|nr:hypothetical protein [Arthrobacter tumbae]MBM7781360.1 hypothetical protein [Arthrobacter tumbae]